MPGMPQSGNVLIVEDNEGIAEVIQELLRAQGYSVQSVGTARRAEAVVRAGLHGVILLDLSLPDSDGLELFQRLKAIQPRNRITIMTAYGELENVIGATAAGAFDFITKGDDLIERVRVVVRNAFESLAREEQVAELSNSLLRRDRFSRMISQSPQMDEVRDAIDKLAHSKVNVLITGQSGTGKEVVARTIHDAGPRHQQSFVAVNCAGIPDPLLESELFGHEKGAFTGAVARRIGKFEAASGGTLFLDEIGEMSLTLQAKVLRVLQDGRFERLGGNTVEQPDVRVITATNRDLKEMVRTGLFREDLYFRIAVFAVHLPPLAERKGDIPLLVEHLVHAAAREEGKDIRGVAPEVMRLFEMHPWPGNVRQLQNVVARSAVVCNTDIISLRDLPDSFVQELQQLHSSEAVAVAARVAEVRTHDMEKSFATPMRSGPPGHSLTSIVQRLQSGPVAERLDYALSLAFPDAETLPRVDDLEAAGIRLAMHRLAGNLQMTARRLNVSRATLYRRLDAAQIHRSATPSTEERSLV